MRMGSTLVTYGYDPNHDHDPYHDCDDSAFHSGLALTFVYGLRNIIALFDVF